LPSGTTSNRVGAIPGTPPEGGVFLYPNMGVKLKRTGITDETYIKDILRKEGYSVYVWSDAPGTYYPVHTHPDTEIRWVVEGEVTIGVEGKEISLGPGDMIELDPNTPHWARTEKGVKYVCGSK